MSEMNQSQYKTKLHSAVIVGEIDPKQIEALAAAGIEGVEMRGANVDIAKAREGRRIAEANGIKIHSLMCGANFNVDSDVEPGIERMKNGLRVASAYGASAMLCVPGRVDAPNLKPSDFNIEFNSETLEVTRVCDGDNAPHARYIAEQNKATTAARRYLPEVLPVAAYEGITIGLENVWNNLWCAPELLAAFVHSFENVRVKSYFDLGNFVKYAPTEEWLRALGKDSIVKLHFKDFLLDKSEGAGGRFVPCGLGSNNWKSIRDTLEEIEYSGFVTIEFEERESTKLSNEQQARKFQNFFNGIDLLEGV